MRYGLMAGKKLQALQAALDPLYRLLMLGFMIVELGLLAWLVALEILKK
jgi:hypothetical protein